MFVQYIKDIPDYVRKQEGVRINNCTEIIK